MPVDSSFLFYFFHINRKVINMPKKSSDNVDTKECSAVTTEEKKPSRAVDDSKVSTKKKKQQKRVLKLEDIDAFDPSATHEDVFEDNNFDDEDEAY